VKQPNSLLKLAAVASSVLLVGGCVAYRAGAFNWLTGTSSQSGEVLPEPGTSEQPTPDTKQPMPTIMGGTKSAEPSIFIPLPNSPKESLPTLVQ